MMNFFEMMDIMTDGHAVGGTIALILAGVGMWAVIVLASAIWG